MKSPHMQGMENSESMWESSFNMFQWQCAEQQYVCHKNKQNNIVPDLKELIS